MDTQEIAKKIETLLQKMTINGCEVSIDTEHRKISIIADDELIRSQVANVLSALEQVVNLMLQKMGLESFVVDLNYYRRERERLITELAKAAAHKAVVTKGEVSLPPMNSYERRIVHMELASRPDLKTESIGIGKDRKVVIKLID